MGLEDTFTPTGEPLADYANFTLLMARSLAEKASVNSGDVVLLNSLAVNAGVTKNSEHLTQHVGLLRALSAHTQEGFLADVLKQTADLYETQLQFGTRPKVGRPPQIKPQSVVADKPGTRTKNG